VGEIDTKTKAKLQEIVNVAGPLPKMMDVSMIKNYIKTGRSGQTKTANELVFETDWNED